MIGQPVLREVIGLRISRATPLPTWVGDGPSARLAAGTGGGQQTMQQATRTRLVLVLRAFVLALDDHAGGKVGDALPNPWC